MKHYKLIAMGCAAILASLLGGSAAYSQDPNGVGSWLPVPNNGWPDNSNGIEAIHMVHLPTSQLLVWSVTDWENHEDTTYKTFSLDTFTLSEPTTVSLGNMFCAGHTHLFDGTVFVAGGHHSKWINQFYWDEQHQPWNYADGMMEANQFSGATGSWTAKDMMAWKRWYPTCTVLPDGQVLVNGGSYVTEHLDGQGRIDRFDTHFVHAPELFNRTASTGSQWSQVQLNNSGSVPFWYYPFIFVLPSGKIFYAGPEILLGYPGEFDATPRASLVLDLSESASTRKWRLMGQSAGAGFMGGSAVMYEPGKVFKSGFPKDHPGSETNKAAFIDCTIGTPEWTQLATMNANRSMHSSTMLPDGSILITGGCTSGSEGQILESNAVLSAENYRPGTTWTHLTFASMQTPRLYHSTAMLLPDARVLVAGGEENGGAKSVRKNAEIFEPPYLHTNVPRPIISTGTPSSVVAGHGIKIYCNNPNTIDKISWIKLGAVTHAFDQDQRFIPGPPKSEWTTGTDVVGHYIQITAPLNTVGNRYAPPGHYMLFIMTQTTAWGRTEYVPSVAKYLQILSPIGL
ncbi:MAG: galactose oxidase early set domain-containing protein [Fimbriimonadales bacterium]